VRAVLVDTGPLVALLKRRDEHLDLDETDVPGMKSLMEKYRDLPMDMADAALVHVAMREDIRRVLTLDQRDFGIYRFSRKGAFTLLP
jgi:predicted nucleic acid-binding protein